MIFSDAKFGDHFKTRNDLLAVYLWKNSKEGHSLIVDGFKTLFHYDNKGYWYGKTETENPLDILNRITI